MNLKQLIESYDSYEEFIDAVDKKMLELIKESPDFKYAYTDDPINSCHYDRGASLDGPECDGCVFGQTFQRLGVEKEHLDYMGTIQDLIKRFSSLEVPSYWKQIQDKQDNGCEWKELIKLLINGGRNAT